MDSATPQTQKISKLKDGLPCYEMQHKFLMRIESMREIKTLKFEAKPIGNSNITTELISGEGSMDEKRWSRYREVVRCLERYSVIIAKEAAKQLFIKFEMCQDQKKDEIYLKKETLDYMKKVAQDACLSQNRAVLFKKESPIIKVIGDSAKNDLLLFQGYSQYFNVHFNRIVKSMTRKGKENLPYFLVQKYLHEKECYTDIDGFIECNFLHYNKMKVEPSDIKKEVITDRVKECLRKISYKDWNIVFLKKDYINLYQIKNYTKTSISGSICIKGTNAESVIWDEVTGWKNTIEKNQSYQTILQFVKWMERFDETIILSTWFCEYCYFVQEYKQYFRAEEVPLRKKMYRITFDRPSLMRSLDWELFRQGKSCSCLLEKENRYYLFLLNPKVMTKLPEDIYNDNQGYRLLKYKQVKHPEKIFPKLFTQSKYNPSKEILRIVRERTYVCNKSDRELWIKHCIFCIKNNSEYDIYAMKFKEATKYENMKLFYEEVKQQGIYMGYDYFLNEEDINNMIQSGQACLFELYCMDFSPFHTGKINNNASLLKKVLSDQNMELLKNNSLGSIRILGATCKLYVRPKQLEPVVYKPGTPFMCKNGNTKVLAYESVKKRRFTQKKYIFSLAIESYTE